MVSVTVCPTGTLGLAWLNTGMETVLLPVVTVANKIAHWPPLSHTEILVLPAAKAVIMAVLPLICAEATEGLELLET